MRSKHAQFKHHFTTSKRNRCKILISCCVCITISIYISVFILEYGNNLTHDPSHLNHMHNTAKVALKEVHEWNYTSIDDRLQRLMIERNKSNAPICDYMSVKGLPFSGTNWLKYILKLIAAQICNSSKLNQSQTASLCIPLQFDSNECKTCAKPHNHIGDWYKFKKIEFSHRLDPTLKNKEYIDIQRLMQRNRNIRFCHFIVLRDPRDAIISFIYWRYYKSLYYAKMPKAQQSQLALSKDAVGDFKRGIVVEARRSKTEIDEFTVNDLIYHNFIDNVQTLNEWWKFYKSSEDKSPQLHFTYFYEDLVRDPVTVIKNMLIYVGVYPHIVGDAELESIVAESKFNKMVENHMWTMLRNGRYCNFTSGENKVLEDTVDFMNSDMTQNMIRELLYKFNQNCAIYTASQIVIN